MSGVSKGMKKRRKPDPATRVILFDPMKITSTSQEGAIEIIEDTVDDIKDEGAADYDDDDSVGENVSKVRNIEYDEIEYFGVMSPELQCEICGIVSFNRQGLLEHKKIHEKLKDQTGIYKCNNCPQRFISPMKLMAHKNSHRVVVCEFCGRNFDRKSNLRRHQAATHSDSFVESSFVCEVENCGKKFINRKYYEDHINYHKGLRLHACTNCEKRFIHRFQMIRHEKGCRRQLQETCALCGKTYADSNALKVHQESVHLNVTHTCSCGKTFTYYSSLCKHRKATEH